jgi:hypothetical protein
MRRALLAAALLIAGSCGGSPTSPSPPGSVPTARAVTLESGPYTLAITFSRTGLPTCQNGLCTSISLCTGNPSITTASFNVVLERSGDTATVRVPGSASPLVLNLAVAPASVTGTISGSALDAQGVMVETSGTVTGAAPSNAAYAVSGNVDGQMSVAGGSCSNNGHAWSLAPR